MRQSSLPQEVPLRKTCVLFIEEKQLFVEAFRVLFAPPESNGQPSATNMVVHLPLAKAVEYMNLGIYDVVVLGANMEEAGTISATARELRNAKYEGPKPPVIVFSNRSFETVPDEVHAVIAKANYPALLAAVNAALQK